MVLRHKRQRASSTRQKLLSTALMPAIIGAGVVVGGGIAAANSGKIVGDDGLLPMAQSRTAGTQMAMAMAMAMQCRPCNPCNPCAAKKMGGCNPCNPCAAKMKGCNPCNPCAAKMKGCNPCNPCAGKKMGGCNPCNPCNPCAGGGGGMVSEKCYVEGMKGCNPCNPCAAKKGGCNPCGAHMHGCNPCNPCAAKKMGGCNPCNPCAAKKMGGCNPCNPCAAKKMGGCNPCNPCAAKGGCNPCNPCGAGGGVSVNPCQAKGVYECLESELEAAYNSVDGVSGYTGWASFNTVPYQSATHGNRYVNNYSNDTGEDAYGRYENVGDMPVGSVLVKDSFSVNGDGSVALGPLFVMEKMGSGFNAGSDNWKYTLAMPGGNIVGVTNGQGSGNVQFCVDCHVPLADAQDSLYFLPQNLRK